ncbi:hypothetical protein [Nocardia lijiangensis]|uniref:hypothetical protein n=1 Tax=Nocardia lijiangensis TaxID=299618 RepID=UPI003D72AAC1
MKAVSAFWIDRQYDRESAGDGQSRFGRHVERHAADFADCWGDIAPVSFACVAWRLATPPHLEPGFARFHHRVLSADCLRNPWDGTLIARLSIVSPWPDVLSSSRVWGRDRGWRGWPETFGQYLAPSHEEISRNPYARATLLIDAPISLDELPAPPDARTSELVGLADRAVTVITRELNELLVPMLTALDTAAPS